MLRFLLCFLIHFIIRLTLCNALGVWDLFCFQHAYPQQCPSGTYSPFTNLKHVDQCLSCPAGYYCDPPGQTNVTGVCPPGHYCPERTGPMYSYPCPVGFYRKTSAAVSTMDCSACIAGSYCNSTGLSEPLICPKVGFFVFVRGSFN